jgi:uncharacterized MAPEG superfamily protein
MKAPILLPAAVLVAWSLVVLGWLAFARFSGTKAVPREELKTLPRVGGRGQDLDPKLGSAAWPSHNYAHLMEQPTLFYAIVMILALAGAGTGLNVTLAWGYVGLRMVHSIWQITVNTLPIRFALFILSTVCLAGLTVNAIRATM